MTRRVLSFALVFSSLCLSLAAQRSLARQPGEETIVLEELRDTSRLDAASALALSRPDLFSTANRSILIYDVPALTLLDGRRFPLSSGPGWPGANPFDFFPVAFLSAVEVSKVPASPVYGSDSSSGFVNLRLNRDYAGGEVGFLYGKGKYGEEKQAYIIGTVGNEKFQITAGYSYQESTINIPRQRLSIPQK